MLLIGLSGQRGKINRMWLILYGFIAWVVCILIAVYWVKTYAIGDLFYTYSTAALAGLSLGLFWPLGFVLLVIAGFTKVIIMLSER